MRIVQAALLVAAVLARGELPAQVKTLTLGIDVNCPSGLGE